MTALDMTMPGQGARRLQQGLREALEEPRSAASIRDGRIESLLGILRVSGFDGSGEGASVAITMVRALVSLGWVGTPGELAEALPYTTGALTFDDARDVMARLGFVSVPWSGAVSGIDARLMPALLLTPGSGTALIAGGGEGGVEVWFAGDAEPAILPAKSVRGGIYIVRAAGHVAEPPANAGGWLASVLRRMRSSVTLLLGLTCAVDALTIATTFAIMAVYDWVIPASAYDTLALLAVGVVCALALEAGFRWLKARAAARFGARLEYLISTSILARVLSLPSEMTATAAVGAQTARMRELETVRDAFSGPMLATALELPFMLLFLGVTLMVGGWVALVPLALVVVYVILAAALVPVLRRRAALAARARTERQNLLYEAVAQTRTIRALGCEQRWIGNFRDRSAAASLSQRNAMLVASIMTAASQAGVPIAGALTMAIGAGRVIEGAMTTGALVATMLLTWRILAPVQQVFLVATRLEPLMRAWRETDKLMRLRAEPRDVTALARPIRGAVEFRRVSFRYPRLVDTALSGVSFAIRPGELVAITGGAGSGKSTVLRLLLNLVQPQAGIVMVDGINVRQLPPAVLRRSIGYLPQNPMLFHGTVAQNLRLADPVASDDDIRRVCRAAGVLGAVEALPMGLDTHLHDADKEQLPAGLVQGLAIARALLRKPKILLLDEPGQWLDADADRAFMEVLRHLKGRVTVIMGTHRPSHMRQADRLMVLDRGQVAAFDVPSRILDRLEPEIHEPRRHAV